MEPIPETVAAIEEYGPFTHDGDLLAELQDMAAQVSGLVPSCVGLSIAALAHGVTFTLVASSEQVAAFDGLQYLEDGPCVDSARSGQVIETRQAVLNEQQWQLFGSATAAHGIESTLSMPVLDETGEVVAGVNLYAAEPEAFAGKAEALAELLGAWAGGATSNADLSFSTRVTAREAPETLRRELTVARAIGMLAARDKLSVDEAADRLREAADRAGVTVWKLAQLVVENQGDGHDSAQR